MADRVKMPDLSSVPITIFALAFIPMLAVGIISLTLSVVIFCLLMMPFAVMAGLIELALYAFRKFTKWYKAMNEVPISS